jgi:hypothetical protein
MHRLNMRIVFLGLQAITIEKSLGRGVRVVLDDAAKYERLGGEWRQKGLTLKQE